MTGLAPLEAQAPAGTEDPVKLACKGRVRQDCRAASYVATNWRLPGFEIEPEAAPTETLADALDAAYRTAPSLQAQRYQLRASDEDYAQALSELRPTTEIQITGNYSETVAGRTTQATRFGATSRIITDNTLTAQAIVNQPLYTGGRAAADRDAGLAEIGAGRAQLRGVEGDLILQVITSYVDIRRDSEAQQLRLANLKQLEATLGEVKARREAGELTRTDIAQAETQLQQAQSLWYGTAQQLEQDRATFAALVGHDPGVLAQPPALPNLPTTISDAFATANRINPDLEQAIAAERESRARIASARAAGRPTLALTGTATLTGRAIPFYLHNEDRDFAGQAVLTIPLTNGGRVGSLVAQAEDRNSVDRIGIEAMRRQMVDAIVNAWNALATAQRNIDVNRAQVDSAAVFDDGTFQEYRAGLRSTFDVLFAHGTLRDAEIALVNARCDLYVAEATLLRHLGLLEVRTLMTGAGLYDPDVNLRHAAARGSVPWDGTVRALDRIARPHPIQPGIVQPPLGKGAPLLAAGIDPPAFVPPAVSSPNVPLPGTVGTPQADQNLKHP